MINEDEEEIRIMRKAWEIVRKYIASYDYENVSYRIQVSVIF